MPIMRHFALQFPDPASGGQADAAAVRGRLENRRGDEIGPERERVLGRGGAGVAPLAELPLLARAGRLRLLALPRGTTHARAGTDVRITSREGRGSWSPVGLVVRPLGPGRPGARP